MALNLLRDDAVMQLREINRRKKSVLGDMTQAGIKGRGRKRQGSKRNRKADTC